MYLDMNLVMDAEQEGLLMFFKDWEIASIEYLWNNPDSNSREVWEGIEKKRSRASIINFLEDAHNLGILDKFERSGKGGYHGIYKVKWDKLA